MIDAGLGSLPGGGAEIFHPEVRDQICEHKADARRWFEIHRTAHELGLRSNCTMLYGHIEQPYHRIDHLIRLRELQDETGGFQTFIPLAFHPENTGLVAHQEAVGLMDLRTMAVSRLMLDNFPHIKAYWIMLGIGTAQVALAYGADDIDGTVRHELIYHDAGATTPEILSVDAIRRLIIEAGREPVERDTLYHRVDRDGTRWQAGAAITAASVTEFVRRVACFHAVAGKHVSTAILLTSPPPPNLNRHPAQIFLLKMAAQSDMFICPPSGRSDETLDNN